MFPRRMSKAFIPNKSNKFINPETGNKRVVITTEEKPTFDRSVVYSTNPTKYKIVNCFTSNSAFGDKVIEAAAKSLGVSTTSVSQGPCKGLNINFGILRGSEILLQECIRQKLDYLYIDHAYFNSGHETKRPAYRVTLNGLQQNQLLDVPGDRFDKLGVRVKPWKKSGDYILVCPPTDAVMNFYKNWDWLTKTLNQLRRYTKRKIIVRTKPNETKLTYRNGIAYPVSKAERQKLKAEAQPIPPLVDQLKNAWAVVTFTSSAGIEAAINGVPVFCDRSCASAQVGLTNLSKIEQPIYPDRTQWLNTLAYSQFYIDEIRDGSIWRMLGI